MSLYWDYLALITTVAFVVMAISLLIEMHRRRKHREEETRYHSAMLAYQEIEMSRQRSHRKAMLALAQAGNGSLETLALQGTAAAQQLELLVSWFQGGPVESGSDPGSPPPPPASGISSRPPPAAPPKQKGDSRSDPIDDLLARGLDLFGIKRQAEEACNLWHFTALWHSLHGRRSDGKPPAAAELGSALYVAGLGAGAHERDGSSKIPPLAAASRTKRGEEQRRHGESKKRRPLQTEMERLCLKYQITASSVYGAADPWPDEWTGGQCRPWTVTLSWRGPQGKSEEPITITVSFFQGLAHEDPPTAADVLSSLLRDAAVEDYSSFEHWAAEFGYDPDSRKAERIYRRCLELAPRVRAFCGQDVKVLAELRNAEH